MDLLFRKTAIYVLILAIGIFILNRTLFLHVHILTDGSVAIHAHPSADNDGQDGGRKHTHTGGELQVLQHQDLLYGLEAAPGIPDDLELDEEKKEFVIERPVVFNTIALTGRAPPIS